MLGFRSANIYLFLAIMFFWLPFFTTKMSRNNLYHSVRHEYIVQYSNIKVFLINIWMVVWFVEMNQYITEINVGMKKKISELLILI